MEQALRNFLESDLTKLEDCLTMLSVVKYIRTMKTEDKREVVYFPFSDSRNDKKAVTSLLNKPSPVIEVSFPTPKVPTLIRVETLTFSLRFKRSKLDTPAWMTLGKEMAAKLKSIGVGEVGSIPLILMCLNKDGTIEISSDEQTEETYKCLSPGWFKVEESQDFTDFFDTI